MGECHVSYAGSSSTSTPVVLSYSQRHPTSQHDGVGQVTKDIAEPEAVAAGQHAAQEHIRLITVLAQEDQVQAEQGAGERGALALGEGGQAAQGAARQGEGVHGAVAGRGHSARGVATQVQHLGGQEAGGQRQR